MRAFVRPCASLLCLLSLNLGAESKKDSNSAQDLKQKVSCELLPQKTSADLWNLAQCYQESSQISQAVATLRTLSKNPKEIQAHFLAAWLLWEEGHKAGGRRESELSQEAIQELENARRGNPTHWLVDKEFGDFYFVRLKAPEKALAEYEKAREHYNGDHARAVPAATAGLKSAIENRLARTSEALGRTGDVIEASCRALYFDPDDAEAKRRIERLEGSCDRKKVKDPRPKTR